jgi:hypothetical protein
MVNACEWWRVIIPLEWQTTKTHEWWSINIKTTNNLMHLKDMQQPKQMNNKNILEQWTIAND